MNSNRWLGFILFITPLLMGAVYQWKDEAGKTVFSDQPPPDRRTSEKNQKPRDIKSNVIDTSGPDFNLKKAIQQFPITLWVNSCGEPCDEARQLLRKRRLPFATRNPLASQSDLNALRALSGETAVPVLQLGKQFEQGFDAGRWEAALDAAGYPKANP